MSYELDNNFGIDNVDNFSDIKGVVLLDLSGQANSVIIDKKNDHIIVVGTSYANGNDFAIVKIDQNGNYVDSFKNSESDTSGVVLLDLSGGSGDYPTSVLLDDDNNIIVAGYSNANGSNDFAIVKIDQNGSYVDSFKNSESDISGVVLLDLSGGLGLSSKDRAHSVLLDDDNNIIVAGFSDAANSDYDFAIVKIDPSGKYIDSFGRDMSGNKLSGNNSDISGVVLLDLSGSADFSNDARSVLLDKKNGHIIVVGTGVNESTDFAIVKIDQNGKYIDSFGRDMSGNKLSGNNSDISGVVLLDLSGVGLSTERAYSALLDDDNNIIVAGFSYANGNYDFAIVKIDPSGAYVESFGRDMSGNKLSGNNSDISGVVLLDLGGSFESAYSVLLDDDNNIIVAGTSNANGNYDFAIVKIDQSGAYVESFKNSDISGVVLLDLSGGANSVVLDKKNDHIIVAGTSGDDFAIVKIDHSGAYVDSFKNSESDTSGGVVLLDLSGGVGLSTDAALSVFLDKNENIIVVGSSNANGNYDFAIVKLKLKYTKEIIRKTTRRRFYIYKGGRGSPYDEWFKKINKKINQ